MTIESISPILSIEKMERSLAFYCGLLDFENAEWGDDDFTGVSRDGSTILLRRHDDEPELGRIYLAVDDACKIHDHLAAEGATILMAPTARPWGLEIAVEDPDGNILRFGSEPETQET